MWFLICAWKCLQRPPPDKPHLSAAEKCPVMTWIGQASLIHYNIDFIFYFVKFFFSFYTTEEWTESPLYVAFKFSHTFDRLVAFPILVGLLPSRVSRYCFGILWESKVPGTSANNGIIWICIRMFYQQAVLTGFERQWSLCNCHHWSLFNELKTHMAS